MDKEIGFCGEECYKCDLRIATINHADDEQRTKIAEMVNSYMPSDTPKSELYTKDDIYCEGCHAENGQCKKMCSNCPMRRCGVGKDCEHCWECKEYPCKIIEELFPIGSDLRKRLDTYRCNTHSINT